MKIENLLYLDLNLTHEGARDFDHLKSVHTRSDNVFSYLFWDYDLIISFVFEISQVVRCH